MKPREAPTGHRRCPLGKGKYKQPLGNMNDVLSALSQLSRRCRRNPGTYILRLLRPFQNYIVKPLRFGGEEVRYRSMGLI